MASLVGGKLGGGAQLEEGSLWDVSLRAVSCIHFLCFLATSAQPPPTPVMDQTDNSETEQNEGIFPLVVVLGLWVTALEK